MDKDSKQVTAEEKALAKAQRKAEFEAKFKKIPKTEDAGKSKAQLKAERRAKQEAQRAAKAEQTTDKNTKVPQSAQHVKSSELKKQPLEMPLETQPKLNQNKDTVINQNCLYTKQELIMTSTKESPERVLYYLPRKIFDISTLPLDNIPAEVVQIGYRINKKIIDDPTSRCIAMLMAFYKVIENYQPKLDIKRELQNILFKDSLTFLDKCRPLSIGMTNIVKYLKFTFLRLSSDLNDADFRTNVCNAIKTFIKDEIMCSRAAISENSIRKIFFNDNQTILTLGYSSIVGQIFLDAINEGKKFKVIVVDTRPRFEGKRMAEFLNKHGIPFTYILINAVLYVIKDVNKVMFEAHSVLCNGFVMSTIGSSQIALVAQAYNIPVLVCCETFKYSDRAYTDCFINNELGDDTSFLKNNSKNNNGLQNLNFLDFTYDLIPREFVSAVITEKGFLPCTSVPAILRFRDSIYNNQTL